MLDRSPDLPRMTGAQPPARAVPPGAALSHTIGPYSAGMLPADTKALFGQLVKIIYKHRWKLVHFVTIAMLLTLVLQYAFPRLYSATAVLRIDRHSAAGALGPETAQISSINDMDETIETDMEMGESDPVLRPVVEKYHLIDYTRSGNLFARWFGGKPDQAAVQRAKEAPIVLKGLALSRPAGSYLIRVTYRTFGDPRLAANVANGVAESLVSQVKESLDQSYNDLATALHRDMDQLRSKMEVSQQRLSEYQKGTEHGRSGATFDRADGALNAITDGVYGGASGSAAQTGHF